MTHGHTNPDPFQACITLNTPLGQRTVYSVAALVKQYPNVERLPYSIRVLLEAVLRHVDGYVYTTEHVQALANYDAKKVGETEIPFMPGRVVLQDFTGVPCVVDLAAMRSAMARLGKNPKAVNPLVPCDLVIDHSVQVDAFGSDNALTINSQLEFERNSERYSLLKWAQQSLTNFRVVPPATGIVHQVNLEYLAKVVWEGSAHAGPLSGSNDKGPDSAMHPVLYPDSLVGTDSHTTMINGLGVLGWGVGGIEAEAVMLGQPIYMLIPEVVGFKLTGKLPEGSTATDLVLRVTQMLREFGVVNKFVEFFGPGMVDMPVANRATLANMAPEYGATCGYFPIDAQTLAYLRLTGRDEKLVQTVEQYAKATGFWRDAQSEAKITYSAVLELDLATIVPALAGPRRPQDRIDLCGVRSSWQKELPKFITGSAKKPASIPAGGTAVATATPTVTEEDLLKAVATEMAGQSFELKHGAVVIAAITSCTNTSNPDVMIAAGLVAQKAVMHGLTRKPWVKTSLAPGSKVVTEYLREAALDKALDHLGFQTVGYGCTTCIGNSGPLPEAISKSIAAGNLVVASVLSGNRNFEGRVHAEVKANYLASPPLVVAYALAGNMNVDLTKDPIGVATTGPKKGQPIYLADVWPTQQEVAEVVARSVQRKQFETEYAGVSAGSKEWQAIAVQPSDLFAWEAKSTYVQEPPYFIDLPTTPAPIKPIVGARCLVKVADSVTTDHISPAGSIKKDSPAGKYLIEQGVPVSMFNSYGSRRGNDRVMTRGTYANIRVKNQLAPGTEGGWTTDYTDAQVKAIYDASVNYLKAGKPLVVLAGKDYGMGSSRDWAAKGVFLLGVRAVIAESFERIHRSNLVGMGVLPMCYQNGQSAATLGLQGDEIFDIAVDDAVKPKQLIKVTARRPDGSGSPRVFEVVCRIDTPVEVDYYRNGGILQTVLRRMAMS